MQLRSAGDRHRRAARRRRPPIEPRAVAAPAGRAERPRRPSTAAAAAPAARRRRSTPPAARSTPAAPPASRPPHRRRSRPPRRAAPIEPISPPAGRLERLRGRLSRSRSTFGQGLLGLLGAGDLDEDSWDRGRGHPAARRPRRGDHHGDRRDAAHRAGRPRRAHPRAGRAAAARGAHRRAAPRAGPGRARAAARRPPGGLLVAGVNGTGKTTTTGKLARVLVADGRGRARRGGHVPGRGGRAAGDLGERAGAERRARRGGRRPGQRRVRRGQAGAEDAAWTRCWSTPPGRLHTKTGLMDELGKVKRVVEKQAEVDEVLLVLDATTGQNGLIQARVFAEVVDVTGIVLTKLDGTAKGGIVVPRAARAGRAGEAGRAGGGRRRPGAVRAGGLRRRAAAAGCDARAAPP